MPPPHALLHRTVAGYRLTGYVGTGGMGEVFRAQHPGTGRLAAVKVLHRPELEARFRNEATVQAGIAHPNVAALLAVGQLDGRPALVMEWVEGQSLDDLIRRQGRLDSGQAGRIFVQVAGAVARLHAQGVVHRDIKPSNVRIRPDGGAKVLDFGIAKGRFTPRLTQEGYIVGTGEYMAPEQFRNQVEPKSDVWALGVLLYELTTGHLPFEAANPLVLRSLISRGQYTDPRVLSPGLAPHLADLIARCLQPAPTKRPTAAELTRLVAAPNQPQALRWRPWAGALAALAVGLALVAWLLGSPGPGVPTPERLTDSDRERLEVHVLNADDDVQLRTPDGRVQTEEPFVVERDQGQPLTITIRHRGREQAFTIAPEVKGSYQCFFDP